MASTGDGNVFEDLSGVTHTLTSNPYDALISICYNNKSQLQDRYATHRTTRNAQQKDRMLDTSFQGFNIDPVLFKLSNPKQHADFTDPRHCLVFWARPPVALKALIGEIQTMLRILMPNLWLMPLEYLHMTALEITHSKTKQEIETLVQKLRPQIPTITDYPSTHRARLIKPILSYDTAAIALSFLPAAGEGLSTSSNPAQQTHSLDGASEPEVQQHDAYTYHHLRRSLHDLCTEAGVEVASRYTVPSAHLTIARFITQTDICSTPQGQTDSGMEQTDAAVAAPASIDREKIKKLLCTIEDINEMLREEYWPREGATVKKGGEWIVGEEKGLDCRRGTLWYGGGETVRLGKGFAR